MKRRMKAVRTVARWQRLLALALAAVCVLSAAMTGTAAWADMSQHRTNAIHGSGAPMPAKALLQKYERDRDGNATTTPVPGAHFALYRMNPDGTAALLQTFITGPDGQALASDLEPGNYYWQETHPAPGFLPETEDGQPKKYLFTLPSPDGGPVISIAYNIRQYGRLTLLKTVKNSDNSPLTQEQLDMLFEFAVTFSGGGGYLCSISNGPTQTIVSGGKLYLKSGQSAQFADIPAGVLYEITETPAEGYTTTSENNAGNVPPQGVTASFTNTYNAGQPGSGSLEVTKTVTGEGADPDKEFSFTATIGGQAETFTLKHGQSKRFADIPLGTGYTVKEANYIAGGYIPTNWEYSGTIQTDGAVIALPFVNHYQPPEPPGLEGSLEISKAVTGPDADPAKAFTFQVTFAGDGAPASPQTFSLKAGEKKTFPAIPHGVAYTVTETDAGGYSPDFTTAAGVIAGNQTAAVSFVNRAPDVPANLWITVTKRVQGDPPDSDKDKLFHFTLTISGAKHEFDLKPGETSQQFAIRPGEAYSLAEQNYTGDGYTQSGAANGSGTAGSTNIEILWANTYTAPALVDIESEKTWDFAGAPPGTHLPESITLQLKHGNAIVRTAAVRPGQDGKWRHIFTGLPKYDALGEEIQYTVEEVRIPGWMPVREGYGIKNVWQPPVIVEGIEIEKAITGTPPSSAVAFTFILTPISGPPVGIPVPGSREITVSGAGKVSFGPITYPIPGVYVYTIAEKEVGLRGWSYDASVYTLTVTVTEGSDGRLTASKALTKSGAPAQKALFTNRYSETAETISVRVTKIWQGVGNHPQSVQAQLYRDGTAYGGPATLSSANNWTHTWSGLDKNHVWTVREVNVPEGYTASVTGDQVNGFVITNTRGMVGETTSVKVTKVWKGDAESGRPRSVAMQLYKDGAAFDMPVTLSAANGWTYTWNGLKKGPAWTVNEVNVPQGYSRAVTGDAANGFVVTNTKLPPPVTEPTTSTTSPTSPTNPTGPTSPTSPTGPTGPTGPTSPPSGEEVTINGKKTWNHGGNPVAKRPAAITVIIKADGAIVTQRLITAAEHWSWAFRLPKYNAYGDEITYTVDEARFEDYVKTVDGYNLINTYKPGGNTDDYTPPHTTDPGDKPPPTGDEEGTWVRWLLLTILSFAAFVAALIPWHRVLRKGKRKYS